MCSCPLGTNNTFVVIMAVLHTCGNQAKHFQKSKLLSALSCSCLDTLVNLKPTQ